MKTISEASKKMTLSPASVLAAFALDSRTCVQNRRDIPNAYVGLIFYEGDTEAVYKVDEVEGTSVKKATSISTTWTYKGPMQITSTEGMSEGQIFLAEEGSAESFEVGKYYIYSDGELTKFTFFDNLNPGTLLVGDDNSKNRGLYIQVSNGKISIAGTFAFDANDVTGSLGVDASKKLKINVGAGLKEVNNELTIKIDEEGLPGLEFSNDNELQVKVDRYTMARTKTGVAVKILEKGGLIIDKVSDSGLALNIPAKVTIGDTVVENLLKIGEDGGLYVSRITSPGSGNIEWLNIVND